MSPNWSICVVTVASTNSLPQQYCGPLALCGKPASRFRDRCWWVVLRMGVVTMVLVTDAIVVHAIPGRILGRGLRRKSAERRKKNRSGWYVRLVCGIVWAMTYPFAYDVRRNPSIDTVAFRDDHDMKNDERYDSAKLNQERPTHEIGNRVERKSNRATTHDTLLPTHPPIHPNLRDSAYDLPVVLDIEPLQETLRRWLEQEAVIDAQVAELDQLERWVVFMIMKAPNFEVIG
ncbi:hypothetical protein BC936DRAFT_149665 [Jimgerdemannia flammicorona]|uniref:Uncharacterized protein n=1 Tax=Jimgerdemannia flammicorona TaxID=994334 RepID=A0A433DK29_9FUNG|nr:hypothetical protein BC936DRAFT_149665 [Jimgerdemannia flammicorona]